MKIQITLNTKHGKPGRVLVPRKSYITEQKLDDAIAAAGLSDWTYVPVQVEGRWTALFLAAHSIGRQPLEVAQAGFCVV